MPRRAWTDGAPPVSAALMNAVWEQGFITAANNSEMQGYLTDTTVGANTIPGVAIGALCLRTDNDILYRVNASRQWVAFADFRTLAALARPFLDFYTTPTGTKTGRLTLSTTTFEVADNNDAAWLRFVRQTGGRADIMPRSGTAGLGVTSLNQSYGLFLTDTLTELRSARTTLMKTATLQLQDAVTAAMGPLVTVGVTPAGPNKTFGTDAAGRFGAFDSPPGAGGGTGNTPTPVESFFTPSLPAAVRSAVGETQINLAGMTISPDHPFTVTSNGIVVDSDAEPFSVALDYVLHLNPTAWTSGATTPTRGANASGNRLFVEVYWKKNGTIMNDTRVSHYIRGDESWAPGEHYLHDSFSEIMTAGDSWTLWINRKKAAAAGHEISGYEIVATDSDVHIVSDTGNAVVGLGLRDVLTQTTYASATAGSANTSATQALPENFEDNNALVYLQVGLTSNYIEATTIRTAYLASLTGANWLPVEGIAAGNIEYQPSTRSLRVTRAGRSPRLMYVGLMGAASAAPSTPAATTFLDLTDTFSSYTDGEYIVQTATGLASVAAPTFTLADNQVTAPKLDTRTLADRQAFLNALQIPIHETVSNNNFTILARDRVNQFEGYNESPATGNINGTVAALNVSVKGVTYTISALYQITAAGGTQNNIIFRISPDPSADITADWQLRIGTSLLLTFNDATKTLDGGGRAIYSWTGNSSEAIEGGQAYNCALMIPVVELLANFDFNFSQISGLVGTTQFGDNTIAYTRAIGATAADQAGWRTKAGFVDLQNTGGNKWLYYNPTTQKVAEGSPDILTLTNVIATLPQAADGFQVAGFTHQGLTRQQRITLANMPAPTAGGKILVSTSAGQWVEEDQPATSTGGITTLTGAPGRLVLGNFPAFTTGDKFVIIGTSAANTYTFRQLTFDDLATTTLLNANRLTGKISDSLFTGLSTTEQANIRTALGIVTGSGTPANNSISTRQLDLHTGAGATDPFDATKQATFRQALGITNIFGYTRYKATLVAATTGGGDVGYSATSPATGTLTPTTGFTNRDLTINGLNVRVEGILYNVTGGDDSLQLYFAGSITEAPDLILNINGHDLNSADASTSASDTSYGAAGWLIEWDDIPTNLLVSGSTYNIEIDGGIEAEIDSIIDGLRTLPTAPDTTDPKFLVGRNSQASYETVDISEADEASFLMTVTAVNKSNQNTTIIPLSGNGVTGFFTRSGNYLTARKAGLVHVGLTLRPGPANTGQVKVHARVSNRDVLRADVTLEHYRDVIQLRFTYNFSVNDTLSFWYEARDVPTAANEANVPATPAFATPSYSASNNETTVTITSPSTGTYNYVEYDRRIHGAGTTDWEGWTRIWGDSTTIYVPDVNKERTDLRIRLINSNGAGKYRQHNAGATTTQEEPTNQFGQTVNLTGDIHLSRPGLSVA